MFKNAIFYRLGDDINLTDLSIKLGEFASRQPSALEHSNKGFIAPDKERPDVLARNIQGVYFVKLKSIDKIIPASVVNEEVDTLVKLLDRKVSRKERNEIKDEVITRLLPKAFCKSTYIDAFIDPVKKLIVMDTTSFTKAEDLLSLLRKALGLLDAYPVSVANHPSGVMTSWASTVETMPLNFKLEGKFTLSSIGDTGKKAKFDQYLPIEIREHIENGSKVVSMSMSHDDLDLKFVIDDELRIKGIKNLAEIDNEEDENAYEADCIICHSQIAGLIDELITEFGGEANE
jgi:recombination associated protein RdgC